MLIQTGTRSPSALMQRMGFAVTEEGENVVLTIGNTDIKMHYEAALQLSQWLRVRAKKAKSRAGDVSRHWSIVATLTDLGA